MKTIETLISTFICICSLSMVFYIAYKILIALGKTNSQRWHKEFRQLKKGDKINIIDSRFDRKAVFISHVDSRNDIYVAKVFKDGILQFDNRIMPKSTFIKKCD